jgi:hypothetical protein
MHQLSKFFSVIKLQMFRASSLPIIRSFYCTFGTGKLHALQFHPDSAWKQSSETCMKLSSAECTVENS